MERNRGNVRRGFSLIEISLVVLLIGILMAVVAFNAPGWIARARITATWASMRQIKTALNAYNGTSAAFPPSLAALQSGANPLLDPQVKLQDAWKNDFVYATPGGNGRPFDLFSKGPNGVFEGGGGDDLDIWKEPQE
jgi:general secretion pathway protein G